MIAGRGAAGDFMHLAPHPNLRTRTLFSRSTRTTREKADLDYNVDKHLRRHTCMQRWWWWKYPGAIGFARNLLAWVVYNRIVV